MTGSYGRGHKMSHPSGLKMTSQTFVVFSGVGQPKHVEFAPDFCISFSKLKKIKQNDRVADELRLLGAAQAIMYSGYKK